jgi:protein-tyrosine phosphatase
MTKLATLLVSIALIFGVGLSTQAADAKSVLEGAPNFRDVGGYKTKDGRTVKSGIVYRSGEFPRLTDEDVNKLEGLGVKTVVNFLEQSEIDFRGRDRIPEGTKEVHLPIAGEVAGEIVDDLIAAREDGDFSKIPVSINPDVHRLLVNEGREPYAKFLQEVIAANGEPLAYHCSHGVHRTGTATAILLSVLGVPWDTIRADYLLSNDYRAAENKKRIDQLDDLASRNPDVTDRKANLANIEAFYILRGDYIDASHEEIIKRYGSVDAYVREGLGLTREDIKQLRMVLLE